MPVVHIKLIAFGRDDWESLPQCKEIHAGQLILYFQKNSRNSQYLFFMHMTTELANCTCNYLSGLPKINLARNTLRKWSVKRLV